MDRGSGVGPDFGAVRIDHDAAGRLLTRLEKLKSRAARLAEDGAELDHPLRFGDSWVARLMAGQLRGIGVERDGGLTPALRTFHETLTELEAIVRSSAGQYQQTDEDGVAMLSRATGRAGEPR